MFWFVFNTDVTDMVRRSTATKQDNIAWSGSTLLLCIIIN